MQIDYNRGSIKCQRQQREPFKRRRYGFADKSLKVKGGNVTLKQGTTIKKIRLTDNNEEVDCKVDGMSIVLKTCFLKKK
jgi:hypothetical protein